MKFKTEVKNSIEDVAKVVEKQAPSTEIKTEAGSATEGAQTGEEKPAAADQPKKGRGRPKGSVKFKPAEGQGSTEKPAGEQTPKGEKKIDDDIAKLRAEHNQLSSGATQTVTVDNSTSVDKAKTAWLNGYLLLIVCDVFFPMAISFLFKKTMAENGKTRKHLKLSQKDKDEMMPLADAAAKELALTMSATQTFAIAMTFMYISKVDE